MSKQMNIADINFNKFRISEWQLNYNCLERFNYSIQGISERDKYTCQRPIGNKKESN